MGGKLIFRGADGVSTELELGSETTLGRAPSSHLCLEDPEVSRTHALVRADPEGGFLLLDLGSSNGTFLNDRRIVAAARLKSGDVLRTGATTILFVEDAPASVEPASDGGKQTTLSRGADEAILLGTSAAMADLFRMIERAAAAKIPVLIEGESGTGKELVANAIHRASDRASRARLAVNCAAFTESLLESELFGHRRGAFTGADAPRAGLFEAADGGTVFLDEIGAMPLAMQPKLLRVLQEREVTRLGETTPRKVDLRVISATNGDLLAEVDRGGFRADLYYRVSAFPIRVPPLRERREDIPILAQRFLTAAAHSQGRRVRSVEPDALAALAAFNWPGNVRELQNEIHRCVALATGQAIELGHLSAKIRDRRSSERSAIAAAPALSPNGIEPTTLYTAAAQSVGGPSLHDARAVFEAKYIAGVLAEQGGNVSAAARLLGLTRVGLHRKLRELNIRAR
jgi:transcriptional regulator with GAF, ATPase, and Fis domain